MYCVIKCVKSTRVLKGKFASSVFHSCKEKTPKTRILVTGPQCVKLHTCTCRVWCGSFWWFWIRWEVFCWFELLVQLGVGLVNYRLWYAVVGCGMKCVGCFVCVVRCWEMIVVWMLCGCWENWFCFTYVCCRKRLGWVVEWWFAVSKWHFAWSVGDRRGEIFLPKTVVCCHCCDVGWHQIRR
jgi:hypothetical protein